MRKLIYKKFSLIIKIFISLAILFVLFRLVPYRDLLDVFKHSKKIYILSGFLVYVLVQLIAILRWHFLLHSIGVKASFKDVFGASFSGLFFNLIFPSFVAGDVFKGFSISSSHGETKKVASSVLMDRFNGSFALGLVAFISFLAGKHLLPQEQKAITLSLIILCLVIIFFSLLIFSKRFFLFFTKFFKKDSLLRKRLVSLQEQLYFFRKNPSVFMKGLLFSLPVQILTAISFFVISKAFDVNVGAIYFLILVPIIMMIALMPITIAGAGTREAAAISFLPLIGISRSVAFGISLLNFMFTLLLGLLGGVFYVAVYNRRLQSRS